MENKIMSYEIIKTKVEYNMEYNHGDGHNPEQLDKADKRTLLRTRKGLMCIKYALQNFQDDYKIGFGEAGKMTDEEALGFRECSYELEGSLLEAIEEIDWELEERGFLESVKA